MRLFGKPTRDIVTVNMQSREVSADTNRGEVLGKIQELQDKRRLGLLVENVQKVQPSNLATNMLKDLQAKRLNNYGSFTIRSPSSWEFGKETEPTRSKRRTLEQLPASLLPTCVMAL